MKKRFTDEQIIAMLKEQEAGEKTADLCRRYGISQGTFYKYKSKYGGMEPSDAARLRALEAENGKLKKLLAETMLDVAMLRDVNSKSGNARCEAASCGPSVQGAWSEPASGVCSHAGGSIHCALSVKTT